MYTRYLGSKNNPALLFLHGFMGTGADWLPIVEHLKQDFYCLLPDLPGHGDTPLDSDPGYHSWGTALKEMLQNHRIENTSLIGYSLGGRLALYFTLTYPEMATRIVLESTNPGISDLEERHNRTKWDKALSNRINQDGLESFLNTWYDFPLFESLNRNPSLKAGLCRQRAQQSPQYMSSVLNALSPGQQPDLWSRISEIQIPTLLIAGRLDQKYTEIMRGMDQAIHHSKCILLDECGHNVHLECQDQFLDGLCNWLLKST